MTKPIALGHKVKDIATGITGIAISRCEFLTGNVQWTVQPKSEKAGAFIEPMSFDELQLDYVDDGISGRVTPAPLSTGIVLGECVEDIVSKIKAIAVRCVTYMNGCVYYSLQTEKTTKDESAEYHIEYKRLKVVSKGVVAEIAKRNEADQSTPGARPTGGPAMRPMKRG